MRPEAGVTANHLPGCMFAGIISFVFRRQLRLVRGFFIGPTAVGGPRAHAVAPSVTLTSAASLIQAVIKHLHAAG